MTLIFVGARSSREDDWKPVIRPTWLKYIRCDPERDMTLLECGASYDGNSAGDRCRHARVSCRNDRRVTNVTATVSNTPDSTSHAVAISWVQNDTTVNKPTLFEVGCYNDCHSIAMSVSNQSSSTKVEGLLSSSSYNCCVSVVHDDYTAKEICAVVKTSSVLPKTNTSSSVNTVGGVLGFIVAVLLILLVLLAIALVCLLRPDLKKKVLPER